MMQPRMTDDHPLYYKNGKDEEIRTRWRDRRLGMLGLSVLGSSTAAYLLWWYYQNQNAFEIQQTLPANAIYALALLSFSFVGSIVYQALYFRCPRCQHFTGFDVGLSALTGDVFRRDSFYCYNCSVRLR